MDAPRWIVWGEIELSDVVSVQGPTQLNPRKVTVLDTLKDFGASCRDGKLVDAKGQEIVFFRLAGCWGNPPADYQKILERQDRELARLKKQYRVIEMTCNPSGVRSVVLRSDGSSG